MELEEILNEENIPVGDLQSHLERLGLELSMFTVVDNVVPQKLLALFRLLLKEGAEGLASSERKSWQHKFSNFYSPGLSPKVLGKIELPQLPARRNRTATDHNATLSQKREEIKDHDQQTTGIVKFIDEAQTHGYVIPFKAFNEVSEKSFLSGNGHFIDRTGLKKGLRKGQLLVYQHKTLSGKNYANHINTVLPLFIDHRSTASLLIERQWEQVVGLEGITEPGFIMAEVEPMFGLGTWKLVHKGPCALALIKDYGHRLLMKYVSEPQDRKDDIALLIEILQPLLDEHKTEELISIALNKLQEKPMEVLLLSVSSIVANIPKEVLDPWLLSFNKLSFACWYSGFMENLPVISSQPEVDIWRYDIVQSLDQATLQQVLLKLLVTAGPVTTFIETLPDGQLHHFYQNDTVLAAAYENYLIRNLKQELLQIGYLVFDLESDGERISEVAWETEEGSYSHQNFQQLELAIQALTTTINTTQRLIVGHNITQFDLPILRSYGASPNVEAVWDTLKIEMLLHARRSSYALKTTHTAIEDARHTQLLFLNQVLRILTLKKEDAEYVIPYLPSQCIALINEWRALNKWQQTDTDIAGKRSDAFFRPSTQQLHIPDGTFKKLKKALETPANKILVAPALLHETLESHFNLHFGLGDNGGWMCLSEERIVTNGEKGAWLTGVLLQYVRQCAGKNKPYYKRLPIAIRTMLKEDQAMMLCLSDQGENEASITCISLLDTAELSARLDLFPDLEVIIVGTELHWHVFKQQLGDDFDFATIYDKLKKESVWLQLSGGKSFAALEKEQAGLLGIQDFPAYMHNMWLEKIGKGKLKVWCNLNIDAFLKSLPVKNLKNISWTDESSDKAHAFVVRSNGTANQLAEQARVNPESLYRQLYWTYQFKILEGLVVTNAGKSFVLLLNDYLELPQLQAYARKMGYFIPDNNASLGRQLEILHMHKSSHKLLIATLRELEKVISSNYQGPLYFIWDSFLLQEKYQMLRRVYPIGDTNNNKDDFQWGLKMDQKGPALSDLISSYRPQIDLYYSMIIENHPESGLYMLDARLSDYHDIEKDLKTGKIDLPLWHSDTEYKAQIAAAAYFFPPVHQNAMADFDVEEAKEVLRYIFLMPEGGGEPYQWHSYQHPCLNDILPAEKDLLISLPTGAGKSLLFQGPALFRSAFTCKLSLVVSPLRALMQDQVENLWEMGFYSNVDFISGDKSQAEIRSIYRRVAGGEIALLYITPERFRSRAFENCLLTRLSVDEGLEYAVFDEAHCISQWGQEFRPDYLNAGRKIAGFGADFSLRKLLFSATISEQVFEQISRLMPGITAVQGTEKSYNPVRDHIKMEFRHVREENERLYQIVKYLEQGGFNPEKSRAIIFVKSRKGTEEAAEQMPDILKKVMGENCNYAHKVGSFHAGMDAEERKSSYEQFKNGDIVLLFATKAFGMGMDIPNIHFVTHYSPPGTFEDFLQEIGRAGRNEQQRSAAGFNNTDRPIKTICLTAPDDFPRLKDQLLESTISWHEVIEIKMLLESYIAQFRNLRSDTDKPVAVPLNLYGNLKGKTGEDLDTRFRLALHWLERLQRISLGYLTVTHLSFKVEPINTLQERLRDCPDKEVVNICKALLQLYMEQQIDPDQKEIRIAISALRSTSGMGLERLFGSLLRAHQAKLIMMAEMAVIEPTKLRKEEIIYCRKQQSRERKYPALRAMFALAKCVMQQVPAISARIFDGDELDIMLREVLEEEIGDEKLPWSQKEQEEAIKKEKEKYITDIRKKRVRHAFSIIQLLKKTRHETLMDKEPDAARKISIRQSVFNGYHKKEEWVSRLKMMEADCMKLVDEVATGAFDLNMKTFNWADIIAKLGIEQHVQYLSDLLYILSVAGYIRAEGLMPSGIEVYLKSVEDIREKDLQSDDKKVFDEFETTKKIRELKLIALQVMKDLDRSQHDQFIKGYFACNSLESLLQLLQSALPPNDPLLKKWRGDAILLEEKKLNAEQKAVYDTEVKQHVNVMAGPGTGKTHTLTLRVAKLVHHIGIKPEEILVLAYNRAVVSELKERLGKLFNALGYGRLARRLKIFTFHGLAKRYCREELEGKPFDQWEDVLLEKLRQSAGLVMSQMSELKYILVDEFQDINNVRINLLEQLYKHTRAYLFIIGDPNQSIYGYERIKDGGEMGPWPYYTRFNKIFSPVLFYLNDNHRSYPDILHTASSMLSLNEEYRNLIPRPTRIPDAGFMTNYVELIDTTKEKITWWSKIPVLLAEKVAGKEYRQIAILFRTNNEVFRGYQKVKELNLPHVRIRIQGALPYEFSRIRECHAVMAYIRSKSGLEIAAGFKYDIGNFIQDLIKQYPGWNHFYLRVIHAIVLEFLAEQDEYTLFDELVDFISELTHKDDGQLYRIYEKYIDEVNEALHETEIVLTTMHKVKGLEFDAVLIPPSFSNLPLVAQTDISPAELMQQLEEEKRLQFVAFTRARYRLLVFRYHREWALIANRQYLLPETDTTRLGKPMPPGIQKLKIGWAATAFNFSQGINEYINEHVKSGDSVSIRRVDRYANGNTFSIYQLCLDSTNRVIGELSSKAGLVGDLITLNGYVVSEVVVWTYEDTCKYDQENQASYADKWSEAAKAQGYIYLVDFVGYGIGPNLSSAT